MTRHASPLLSDGTEVPFAEIDQVLARAQRELSAGRHTRALTATVVAIGSADRLREAADALRTLGREDSVRALLIAEASSRKGAQVAEGIVALTGVDSRFVNNAVAALRLSSLPTLVWWRGGTVDTLDELAALADRFVIDVEEPASLWARALTLVDRTAFGDLHWTRLTRWRTLMAHFFDVDVVREAARDFTSLRISGSDTAGARLFAHWLLASLDLAGRVDVDLRRAAGPPLAAIEFGGANRTLTLKLAPSGTCVESDASLGGEHRASRIVSLGDQSLPALLREELRIRARDTAFERTLRAVVDAS